MSGRITQDQIQTLPDLMSADNFMLNLGSIPSYGDSQDLSLKCLAVGIPGVSNEAFQVNVAGFVRNFRGRRMYTRQLQVQYLEDSLFRTHIALRNWMEMVVGTNSGTSSGYIADYSVNASLFTYDTTGAQVDVATFYNLFIVQLDDTQLSGQNTQEMQVNAMFHYDFVQWAGQAVL